METATLIWLFVLVCLSAAACQGTSPTTATANGVTEPPDTDLPSVTEEPTWVHFTLDDVRMSLRVPAGWEGDTTDQGIVLAEDAGAMGTDGVKVHCFVHLISNSIPTVNSNLALVSLDEIIHDQSYISPNDVVSTPAGFTWDGYEAAYYLLNDSYGNLKIMLALAISDQNLVACSISAPARLADKIRRAMPQVMDSLTVNGHRLDGASLDEIPDPLAFPDAAPEITADSP